MQEYNPKSEVEASLVQEYNTKQDTKEMIERMKIDCNATIRQKGKRAAGVLENVKKKQKVSGPHILICLNKMHL